MIKIAILIGKGGRLENVYRCCKGEPKAELALVISHKKESPGVETAGKWGIESFYFRLSDWKEKGRSREDYNKELAGKLKERDIDLVILAGWDIVLGKNFLGEFSRRVINIHPALSPAFPGLESEKQALDYGVKITGCTLHFVDEGVDTGPIIFQEAVEVKNEETVESLAKKIHQAEDKLLCSAIKLFAQGKIKVEGREVKIL